MRSKKKPSKRLEGRFVALPKVLYDSYAFQSLSSQARDIFMFVCSQYNDQNNGDLTCTHKGVTEHWGMKLSKQTFFRELNVLKENHLLILTVQGHRGRASRYASAVWAIDKGGELEDETRYAPQRFLSIREN